MLRKLTIHIRYSGKTEQRNRVRGPIRNQAGSVAATSTVIEYESTLFDKSTRSRIKDGVPAPHSITVPTLPPIRTVSGDMQMFIGRIRFVSDGF